MDGLRLVLLVLGLLFIGALYLWETRWRRPDAPDDEDGSERGYLDDLGAPPDGEALEHDADPLSAQTARRARATEREGPAGLDGDRRPGDAENLDELARLCASEDPEASLEGLDFIVPREAQEREVRRDSLRALRSVTPRPGRPRQAAAGSDELVIALTVMAPTHSRFHGEDVVRALRALGFEHGDMQIFHHRRRGAGGGSDVRLSVANVLKPGTFDPARWGEFSTPGLALFLRLDEESEGLEAFGAMLQIGRELAGMLGGALRDEGRSTLTRQATNHLRERIIEFGRQQRLKR